MTRPDNEETSDMKTFTLAAAFSLTASAALAAGHALAPAVMASNQSTGGGTVTAEKVNASANGWLVVHRTDGSKPGPVVGHAPIRTGENLDVSAILTEEVKPGEMLMLMVHGEAEGNQTGIFEYSLGAKEDGPVKPDGKLVMTIITAE